MQDPIIGYILGEIAILSAAALALYAVLAAVRHKAEGAVRSKAATGGPFPRGQVTDETATGEGPRRSGPRQALGR